MMNDPSQIVVELIFGRWRSQILYAGVKLGVFDALSSGSKTPADIAEALHLDSALTYRLLRALASLGLLHEDGNRSFALTACGEFLQADHPQTLRGVALLEEGPEHYAAWKHLCAIIRDGQQDGFVREFGHPLFVHAVENPEYGAVFNEGLNSYAHSTTPMVLEALASFDFSRMALQEGTCDETPFEALCFPLSIRNWHFVMKMARKIAPLGFRIWKNGRFLPTGEIASSPPYEIGTACVTM